MAVLVTRPLPDAGTTAACLRARGLTVLLAPSLRFEPVAFHIDETAHYGAVILTSANALRAIEPHLAARRLLKLPLFVVGEQTGSAARRAGFEDVVVADGDAASLRDCILASAKTKKIRKTNALLYLAGEDRARDLAGELGARGFSVFTQTTYRMIAVKTLPPEVCDAFVAHDIEAVLHYSRRSAQAFLDAVRTAGVEISALALPQCCISAAVAAVVRDAGATQVIVAASPDENALFETLDRALRPRSG